MDEFIGEFIVETQEGLTALDTALVAFAEQPDDKALLDQIFRTLHTIKGTCGFLGLGRLEKVAHVAETLLDGFRRGERTATPHDVDLILKALDHIRFLVDAIAADSKEPEGDDAALLALVQAAIDAKEEQPATAQNNEEAGHEQHVETSAPEVPGAQSNGAVSASSGGEQASQFLRIHVDTLEEMLAMVSELVLTRNQLSQIARGLQDSVLYGSLQRLDSVVSDLQDSVMKARMQPIGNAWAKFPRIVHDIARETGKSIHLQMNGEDTEVDRQILELIKDPLMHMVRNSADHGIETAEQRRQAGKPEKGTVNLSARHERGYIIIEIRDDGKGLLPEKIKETVLARSLATAEQLSVMTDRQILSYIFAPGFSTAEKITSISGRGVGMDVVRTNIEKIGGTIDLESTAGKGTCFTIRIPLTLAIIPALLVGAQSRRYAVPQLTVQELIHIASETADKIEMAGECPVLRLREYLLPLVNLDRLMSGQDNAVVPEDCYIVVVHTGTTRFGIIVDTIIGTEDVVVKPVPSALRNLSVFAGNTILGDGRVIMILDPAGIAAQAHIAEHEVAVQPASEKEMESDMDRTALLIFRAHDDVPKAVPAFLVTRIAEFKREVLERSGDKIVVQYQERLIELHDLGSVPKGDVVKALIFSDEQATHIFGVMIDAVDDIVSAVVDITDMGRRAGYLGTAIVAGRATDMLDISHFTGEGGWIPADISVQDSGKQRRVLLVDDSLFFRHMLQPLLNLAGYRVTVASDPKGAFELYERGMVFDVIISDIEMGEMDGFEFAEKIKSETSWRDIPLVALSSRATPQDKEKGYSKGFAAYVSKSDRDALLSTLRDVLEGAGA